MAEVRLWCGVYGEATVFSVTIARDAEVARLQEAIVNKMKDVNPRFNVDPTQVTLYLAKKKEDEEWLKQDGNFKRFLRGAVDTTYPEMFPFGKLTDEEYFGPNFQPGDGEIHVLMQLPEGAASVVTNQGKWSAKELSTMEPDVQETTWKSVVRVSTEGVCSGTALVVDRTPTHLYLLTNLHLWSGEKFTDHLSEEFKTEIKRYARLHPGMKASPGKRKADPGASPKPPQFADKPEVVVEHLEASTNNVEEVLTFRLERGVCWRSSADFDFAIFEVAVEQDLPLERCRMGFHCHVNTPMPVHVFGFPSVLQDRGFEHACAVTPAQVTGRRGNQMALSSLAAPGFSGSGIAFTACGVPVVYIGGGFDGSANNDPDQAYGFTLHGVPLDLPSRLPRPAAITRANQLDQRREASTTAGGNGRRKRKRKRRGGRRYADGGVGRRE